jgi:predicted adenylyl cyclase CyaB
MGRNVEIKARATDFEGQRLAAERLATAPGETLIQEDTFFNAAHGRLKLRQITGRASELIHYNRSDLSGPKESVYSFYHTDRPDPLNEVLTCALGVRTVVRKKRTVYLIGQTRVHLDQVDGLGEFIELEVVLDPGQDVQSGTAVAEELMLKLGIRKQDLVANAYADLLLKGAVHE